MKRTDPAYPMHDRPIHLEPQTGMDIRTAVAKDIMAGFAANSHLAQEYGVQNPSGPAEAAWEWADALLDAGGYE